MKAVLGIDTSCYTTSAAVMNIDGQLLGEHRRLLTVPPGEKGLQQSQAVFQHVQSVAGVFQALAPVLRETELVAVAASTKPRPVEGSYMPVFTVSEALGRVLAHTLGVPFWGTTHQEGHLLAGLWSCRIGLPPSFLAVHLSGGTSELLHVTAKPQEGRLDIKILGATQDLHAGQLVDRVGVALGLPFPAGPHLEKLAQKAQGQDVFIPSSVKGYSFSFSGGETCAKRLLSQGVPRESIARAVENCIAKTLEKVLRRAVAETGIKTVLIVGGVAANRHLRERLQHRLGHPAVGARLFFAEPSLSTDNSVGVALSGVLAYTHGLLQRNF